MIYNAIYRYIVMCYILCISFINTRFGGASSSSSTQLQKSDSNLHYRFKIDS